MLFLKKNLAAVISALTVVSAISASPVQAAEIADKSTEYIFVGDSRFVGMNTFCSMNDYDNVKVIAKVGEGYDWLTKTAENEIIKAVNESEYKEQEIILGLGINDMGNMEKYVSEYQKLGGLYDITVISVNPVGNSSKLSNENVIKFNNNMKTAGFDFIDTYSCPDISFKTVDGVHYTKDTYRQIFNKIVSEL